MRNVSQKYREAIQRHRDRGYRDSVYARITIGSYKFSSDDIIGLTHKRASHPLSLNLPTASLQFTLKNENHLFDPDSGNSIVNYLIAGRDVNLEYGLDVDGKGTIEWFVGGYFYLETWRVNGQKAIFNAVDIFNRLSKSTYKKGVFDQQYHNVHELALAVVRDAGVPKYNFSGTHLTRTYTQFPLPYTSHAECLQLLANLASSTLELDGEGAIVMRQREEVAPEEWVVGFHPWAPAPPILPGTNLNTLPLDTSKYNYATWESNYFALDGEMRIYPESGPYLNTGLDYNLFPINADYPYQYLFDGYLVGVTVDLLRERTFGSIEVEFSEYSRVNSVRMAGFDSSANQKFDYTCKVSGSTTTITDNFTDIKWIRIFVLTSTEWQRVRIRNIRVDNAVWPLLENDDVLGMVSKQKHTSATRVDVHHQGLWYWGASVQEELMKTTVRPGELTEITHSDVFYNQKFTCENPDVVFEVENHYAYTSFVRVSGVSEEVEIAVLGARYASIQDRVVSRHLFPSGELVDIDNPISKTEEAANIAADWAVDYYSNLTELNIPTLGYPESDANDQMRYEGKRAIILENTITLDQGSMRGTIKARGE